MLFLTMAFLSCKKLVEVGSPQNQLTTDKVFSDSSSATAALGTIYAQMDINLESNFSLLLDLYADNFNYTNSSTPTLEFDRSTISVSNQSDLTIWQNLYQTIYECNDLIAQLPISGKLSSSTVNQLSSEAKFLRAYAYFYLVNIYGDVPLLLTTDANINVKASRTSISTIYQQIIKDLSEAKQGLSAAYPGGERVRVNNWAAAALLARVYLYQQNWAAAESESTSVINSGLYTLSTNLSDVFLADSKESILQIWNQYGYITSATQLVPPVNTLPVYPLTTALYNAFEGGDLRKNFWIGTSVVPNGTNNTPYYYSNKYKNTQLNTNSPEYLVVLRIAEQYLIRAEARAQQGKITGNGSAAEDLNLIRNRAGLPNINATTQSSMISAILKERRVELFDEWGNRFFDLRRSGQLNSVIGTYKWTWLASAQLFPIPLNELAYDHNLTQNPGYH